MRKHNTRLQARLDKWLGSFRENNLQASNIIDFLVSCLIFRLRASSLAFALKTLGKNVNAVVVRREAGFARGRLLGV